MKLKALTTPPCTPINRDAHPRLRHTRSLPPAKARCFRCLATDHLVAECREPQRCRSCLRFCHRSSTCPEMSGSSSRFLWERLRGRNSRSLSADGEDATPPPPTWSAAARSAWRSPTIDRRSEHDRSPSPVRRERSRSPVRFRDATLSDHLRGPRLWRDATPYPWSIPSSVGSSSRLPSVEVHAPPVTLEPSRRYAYAFIDPPCADPALFIRRALERCGGDPAFRLAPSSHGAMMVVFLHPFLREKTIRRGTITYPPGAPAPIQHTLHLVRHEEADFRFVCYYKRQVEVSATNWPPEHWNAPTIRAIFEKIGHVCCIDPTCLLLADDRYPDDIADFSAVRVLLLMDDERRVPPELVIRNEEYGLGGIAKLRVVSHWAHTPGTPPPRRHIFSEDGGPPRDLDNKPGAFRSAPFTSPGTGGPTTRSSGGHGTTRALGLGSRCSPSSGVCSDARGRPPALVIRDLPTPVRPRTPPPPSLDYAALVEQDHIESGLRAARSQPRSCLPSLKDLVAEEEHEISVRRRRARRKRAVDSACKRRSRRLAEKEPAHYVSAGQGNLREGRQAGHECRLVFHGGCN
ncbi:unnamed protein product [Urochloa decumbens]|uniref:CCHC-type domain-containing protein n=1 Tax=Urochloa decumbens TaxID=240449 RepID=A0ABC8X228_9POAL